jgi:hypothetical protein
MQTERRIQTSRKGSPYASASLRTSALPDSSLSLQQLFSVVLSVRSVRFASSFPSKTVMTCINCFLRVTPLLRLVSHHKMPTSRWVFRVSPQGPLLCVICCYKCRTAWHFIILHCMVCSSQVFSSHSRRIASVLWLSRGILSAVERKILIKLGTMLCILIGAWWRIRFTQLLPT